MSYIEEAHARAQRRKSPWNLLLIPTFATACGFLWWSFARLVERLHQSIYPSESITHATGAGAIVASVAPFFAAIPLAFIVANAMIWLVPPARRALNHEAQGHPGTTFRQSQQQLLAISKLLVPIALTIAAVGVVFSWSP